MMQSSLACKSSRFVLFFDIVGNVRKQGLALIVALGIIFSSCAKDRNILFDLPFELRLEIPAGLNPLDRHFFLIRDVPTNLQAFKDQFQVGDQMISMRPSNAVLSSVGGNQNWAFLREVEISIFEDNDPDKDTEVFLTNNVPVNAGQSVVVLPFEDDVHNLLDTERVDFKISIRLRGTSPSFIESVVNLSFTAE